MCYTGKNGTDSDFSDRGAHLFNQLWGDLLAGKKTEQVQEYPGAGRAASANILEQWRNAPKDGDTRGPKEKPKVEHGGGGQKFVSVKPGTEMAWKESDPTWEHAGFDEYEFGRDKFLMSFDTGNAGVNFNLHQLDTQTRNDLYDDAYRLQVAKAVVDAYAATAAFQIRNSDEESAKEIQPELGISPESVSAEILLHLVAYDTAVSRMGAAEYGDRDMGLISYFLMRKGEVANIGGEKEPWYERALSDRYAEAVYGKK